MARSYNSFARLGDGIYRFTRGGGAAVAPTGPSVTIVGGVHGNERIGVLVLDALRLALLGVSAPAITLRADAAVTLVYANQQALRIGKRGSKPHADLNRCFSDDILKGPATEAYEHIRARELAPILAHTDAMVDLHSTNKPSPPFVRIAGHMKGLPAPLTRIAARLPGDILLHDPQYLLADGQVALTDEYVGANGGMGVCYESGVATDVSKEKVDSVVASIRRILEEDTGAVEVTPVQDEHQDSRFNSVFELTQVFKLTNAGFRWAPGVGDTNFQSVPASQPIGFVGDRPFAVPYEAVIVFPKVPELWKFGSPLGWLARRKT